MTTSARPGPRTRRHPCACARFLGHDCGEMIPDTATWAAGHDARIRGVLLRALRDSTSVAVVVNPLTAADMVSQRLGAQLRADFTEPSRPGTQPRTFTRPSQR